MSNGLSSVRISQHEIHTSQRRYRIGDQIQTRIVYSARREITEDVVEIRIGEAGARRSPGGLLFPPPGEP